MDFPCLLNRFLHSLSAAPKSLRQAQDRRSVEIFRALDLSIHRLAVLAQDDGTR